MLPALLLALAPPAYRVVDLGFPLGETQGMIEARAVNNRGEVLVKTVGGHVWRNGTFLSMGPPSYASSMGDGSRVDPFAFNDHAVAVGAQGSGTPAFMSGLSHDRAFIWRGRSVEDLGAGATTSATGINNLGDVVGGGDHRAFARLRGKIVWLPIGSHVKPRDPSGEMNDINGAAAVAINDHRLILENSTYGRMNPPPTRPFLIDGNRRPLKMQPVAVPKGFDEVDGLDLNESGTALLLAHDSDWRRTAPFLARAGKLTRLDLVGKGLVVSHADLNNRGDVVCTVIPLMDQESRSPALWLADYRVPFPTFAGWKLQTATGINDGGMICGSGLHDGKPRAYLLVPFRGFGGR